MLNLLKRVPIKKIGYFHKQPIPEQRKDNLTCKLQAN